MTREEMQSVLERVMTWPPERQAELAEIVLEIEAGLRGLSYQATTDELAAIDEAERDGLASENEVEAAFKTFRHA